MWHDRCSKGRMAFKSSSFESRSPARARSQGIAAAALLIVTALFSAHCSSVKGTTEGGEGDGETTRGRRNTTQPEGDDIVLGGTTADPIEGDTENSTSATCTNDCAAEGDKRCSSTANAGTEVCTLGTNGCRAWTPGTDCATNTTCDKTANDGTCVAGCVSDAGCSAANVNQTSCSTDGKTERKCTQEGACFVLKTSRTNILQQCVSATYCGSSGRISCVASAAGACTQHAAVANPCPSGTTCEGAGECVSSCTNDAGCSAATSGDYKCTAARSRQRCALSGACYKWTSAASCSPDATCSGGACIDTAPACTNQCTLNAVRCAPGSTTEREKCVTSLATGCTVWNETSTCASKCSGAGSCSTACTNACTLGAVRCVTGTEREKCVTSGATGCTVWDETTSCAAATCKTATGGC